MELAEPDNQSWSFIFTQCQGDGQMVYKAQPEDTGQQAAAVDNLCNYVEYVEGTK